ncbi:hypothetical protein D3C73_1130840 [compost metagenome]
MTAGDRAVCDLFPSDNPVSQLFRTDAAVLQLLATDGVIEQLAAADASFCQMFTRDGFMGDFGRGNRLIRKINALHCIILQPRCTDDAEFQLGSVNRPRSNLRAGDSSLGDIVSVHFLQTFLFSQKRCGRHADPGFRCRLVRCGCGRLRRLNRFMRSRLCRLYRLYRSLKLRRAYPADL